MPKAIGRIAEAGDTASGDVVALSRRSLVRVGAAAAWTAPLVQVMAAAPAQAVGSATILAISGTFTHSSTTVTLSSGQIDVSGSGSTGSLQVSVTLDSTNSPGYTTTTVATTPASFTVGAGTTNGNAITFVFTATTQMTAVSSRAFAPSFTIPSGMSNKSGSGSATVTSTGSAAKVVTNTYA